MKKISVALAFIVLSLTAASQDTTKVKPNEHVKMDTIGIHLDLRLNEFQQFLNLIHNAVDSKDKDNGIMSFIDKYAKIWDEPKKKK